MRRNGGIMQYRTKVIINGAEILDEQSDTASSITNVKLTESCGQGFQIGSTASSSLSFTMLKPYKESFDGDKVELYILQANAEAETTSLREELEEEVGDSTETLAISDGSTTAEVETVETVDPDEEEAEDMTDEEVAEAEAEWNEIGASLYEFMNGEEVTDEDTGTEIEEAAISWECIGAFYVYSQTNNTDGSVTLQCYDGFNLMNGSYTPNQSTGTFQEFYDDLRTQCAVLGVTVDEEDFTEGYNPTLIWDKVCSYRTAFGYLAGLQGGFGTFDGDSTLGISYYGYSDELFLVPDLLSYSLTSAGETEIDGIICTINLNQDTVEAGDGGQPLKFYNPFVTQEQADSILSQYRGVRYYGAIIKAKWNSDLLAGDLIRVMTSDEYKNYVAMMNAMANASSMTASEVLELKKQINAVGKSVLISSQTISFSSGGEAIAEITSYLQSETEKTNAPASPSDAKFRTLAADLIKTKELIADKATITDLEATNATVDNLATRTATMETTVANKASIDDLKATNAAVDSLTTKTTTMEEAIAKKATVEELEAAVGNIDAINIKKINGEEIQDGTVLAAALSNVLIKTISGNKVYYQADEPTGGDYSAGDIWYKTLKDTTDTSDIFVLYVYNGTTWEGRPFDNKMILANSITAQEIAAGTITAYEIDMNTLQAAIAYIGALDGKHVQIESDSVKVKDGTTVLAEFGENIKLSSDKDQYIGGDDARIYFNHADGTLTITGSKVTIGAVDDVANDLQDTVDDVSGVNVYQYIDASGESHDVIKRGSTYYYYNDDNEKVEVEESVLQTDSDGLVTVYRDGLSDNVTDIGADIKNLEDTVNKNKSDTDDTAESIQSRLDTTDKAITDNQTNIVAMKDDITAVNNYLTTIKGWVNILDGIVVGSEKGSNIKISESEIALRDKASSMATIDSDAIHIKTADITFLRLGEYILESMSDGSLTLKVR